MRGQEAGKTMKRKSSIGGKVFVIMTILILLYLLTVLANISALNIISGNTAEIGNFYLRVVNLEGEAEAASEQMKMYCLVGNYEQDTANVSGIANKLEESIQIFEEEMAGIAEALSTEEQDDIRKAGAEYCNIGKEYSEFCKSVLQVMRGGDGSALRAKVASFDTYYNPFQESQVKFGAVMRDAATFLQEHNTIRVDGTRTFNVLLVVAYLVIAVVSLMVMITTYPNRLRFLTGR